jgi:hypothetical protein
MNKNHELSLGTDFHQWPEALESDYVPLFLSTMASLDLPLTCFGRIGS